MLAVTTMLAKKFLMILLTPWEWHGLWLASISTLLDDPYYAEYKGFLPGYTSISNPNPSQCSLNKGLSGTRTQPLQKSEELKRMRKLPIIPI